MQIIGSYESLIVRTNIKLIQANSRDPRTA